LVLAQARAEKDPAERGARPVNPPALEPPASNGDDPMRVITKPARVSPSEAAALLAETQALHQLVRELTEPRAAGGIDPNQCAGPLCDELWAYCGRHKMAWLRTKINQRLERETGKRSPAAGGSQDRLIRATG
jgi:hypothetical protein